MIMHSNRLKQTKKQQGFIILMGMLALVLGAAVWFGTASSIRSESMQISIENENINALYRVKDKMLTYALLQPEIFRTSSSSTTPLAQEDIPGPGYFPCPDTDNDGVSNSPCAGSGVTFVTGLVPRSISSRVFSFIDQPLESGKFWYAVDSHFLTQNQDYFYNSAYKRFVPLNTQSPATASLTLDGATDIVMVLIYSGGPLSGQSQTDATLAKISDYLEQDNADGDANFISHYDDPAPVGNNPKFNDYVIAITRSEWNAAMLSRISMDADGNNVPDLCVDPAAALPISHWFNGCSYVGAAPSYVDTSIVEPATGLVPSNDTSSLLNTTCFQNAATTDENLYGQGWRTVLGCP